MTVYAQDTMQSPMHDSTHDKHAADVDMRGDHAMGFSHETSKHHFELLSDGGIIQVDALSDSDTATRDQIRQHLAHIAAMFSANVFDIPMFIHGMVPPGVPTMKEKHAEITYSYMAMATGGMVRITTLDPVALKAVHDFLEFQIEDHRTGDSAQGSPAPAEPSANAKTPAYDVVVIKPNKSGSGSISANTDEDTYTATNVSLKMIMQNAYDIKLDLIFGLTGWADTARFDVQAKIVDMSEETIKKLTPDERRAMLRQLLEDRFQLKVHKQIETLPVYEMVIAKSGLKLKEVEPPRPDSEIDEHKTLDGIERGNMRMGSTQLFAHDVGLSLLTSVLSHQLRRTVLDKTGLRGKYDLALNWSTDDPAASSDSSAPVLFTALEEQMGLKLQPTKGAVETLVVDHVEMPKEN
jgi:uncharacterized protein (TIGR03435 family)